jgi:hypothetical protein
MKEMFVRMLFEDKFEEHNGGIKFGKSFSSMAKGPKDNTVLVFNHPKEGRYKVHQMSNGKIYADIANKYDHVFPSLKHFITHANKHKMEFDGADDYEG